MAIITFTLCLKDHTAMQGCSSAIALSIWCSSAQCTVVKLMFDLWYHAQNMFWMIFWSVNKTVQLILVFFILDVGFMVNQHSIGVTNPYIDFQSPLAVKKLEPDPLQNPPFSHQTQNPPAPTVNSPDPDSFENPLVTHQTRTHTCPNSKMGQ